MVMTSTAIATMSRVMVALVASVGVAHEIAKAEKAGRRAGARTERINVLAETGGSGDVEEDSTVCVLWSAGL